MQKLKGATINLTTKLYLQRLISKLILDLVSLINLRQSCIKPKLPQVMAE